MTEIVEFINGFTSKLLESVKNRVAEMSVFEIIINLFDIIIMTALFFAIYKFIKKRRAGKLAVGLILIVLATFLSSFMGMKGIQFILSTFYQVGMIAIIIVFQPELRAALEKVGGNPLVAGIKSIGMDSKDAAFVNNAIEAITDASKALSSTNTGAIIVLENTTKLGEYIKPERVIDANLTSALLQNIFHKNAPLHDGAVIIRNFKIHAAGCFLPMPSNDETVGSFGSRHRAGVGVSEFSDALVIIISEERGAISAAFGGELFKDFDAKSLENLLREFFYGKSVNDQLSKKRKKGERRLVRLHEKNTVEGAEVLRKRKRETPETKQN